LYISASRKARLQWPVGTIYKVDLVLVQKSKIKNYYRLRKGHTLLRAVEFFDHNQTLQKYAHANQAQTGGEPGEAG
jgi:hypothetical protein